jgi:hypothetical protein
MTTEFPLCDIQLNLQIFPRSYWLEIRESHSRVPKDSGLYLLTFRRKVMPLSFGFWIS